MKKNGFTIIEMLVVIFFLSVGMVGVLIAIQQTMAGTEVSSQRLTAIYLCQEGIEIVRNIRDGNWLEQIDNPALPWDDGLNTGDYEGDYTMAQSLASWAGRNLKIDAGFYKYSDTGTSTPFQRKISISKSDQNQMKVSVTVYWDTHEITVEEHLYNWRQ